MSTADRAGQVAGHLSNTWGRGLLSGEVAIITGSAQGIGRSAALLFAREGAKVVVSDLDGAKAEAVVQEIKSAGGDAIAIAGDVTAADFPKRLVTETVNKYGKINHIVNNAGFTFDKMLHGMSDDTFELILKVHNTAPFRIIREAAPYFRIKDPSAAKENRSIVNVSSTSGLHGNVGQANYAVAKAGVVGLTKTGKHVCLRVRAKANSNGVYSFQSAKNGVLLASGVTYIETRMTAAKEKGEVITVNGQKIALGIPGGGGKGSSVNRLLDIPLGRPGTADEAAAAMLFLCSPLANYISGHTLEVTGGRGI